MVSGISVSPGIAFGKALLLKEEPIIISQKSISAEQIDAEIRRFTDGRDKASVQLNAIKEMAEKKSRC